MLYILILLIRMFFTEVQADTFEDGSFVIIGCVRGAMCDDSYTVPHRTYVSPTYKVEVTQDE